MLAGYLIVMLPEYQSQGVHYYNGLGSMVTDWTQARVYADQVEALREARGLGLPVDVVELQAHIGGHIKRFLPEQRGQR